MANKKMSDTAVFKTGASNIAYNNIANIDGVVGWSNFTGANENVAISGTQLVTSLESNLYTSAPLPIAKGGTGITKYGEACEMFLDVATIGGVSIGNTNNDKLINTSKVCIKGSTGRVGIGTTSPNAPLEIHGGAGSGD